MKGKRKTVVPKVIILDRDGVILCHVEKYILKKDNCFCRKPKNGLIKQVMVDYGVESDECWLIGDADTDILAGINSGISHNYQVLSGRQDKPCGLQKGTFKNLKELVENFEKLAEDEYGK